MIFRINSSSAVPVFAQIVEQIQRAIALGALRPGDPLPSLRELATRLSINPLTVGRAYKELETSGFIETRHGLGSVVAANSADLSTEFAESVITRALDALLIDAHHLGISTDNVRQLLEQRLEAADLPPLVEFKEEQEID